jgi:hypothetical protein
MPDQFHDHLVGELPAAVVGGRRERLELGEHLLHLAVVGHQDVDEGVAHAPGVPGAWGPKRDRGLARPGRVRRV